MKEHYYVVHIQYLGFRFHGWQKQPGLKTVHLMVDKTIAFVMQHKRFKTLGCSRTDARVSANHYAFELFLEAPIIKEEFLTKFDANLPNDIRAIKIDRVDENFNIIQASKIKAYQYLFTFGEKPHPFTASIMTHFKGDLDIELMQDGAQLFEGKHHFGNYCTKPAENTNLKREVLLSKIEENTEYQANFFPKKSYIFNIHSNGFMRYQVRLIMGQLIQLGRHEVSLDEIKESLANDSTKPLREIAPGSGLILNKITFDL